jgi:cbb3-type cytochrome oxidase subunit 3
MTAFNVWLLAFAVLVIGGNVWVYWNKWQRKKAKKR